MRFKGQFVWTRNVPSPKYINYWRRHGWNHDPVTMVSKRTELARYVGPQWMYTTDAAVAALSQGHSQEEFKELERCVAPSYATEAEWMVTPSPEGLDYMPFQQAGIEYAVMHFVARKKKAVLIADEMGLGKTIQAIGIINQLRTLGVMRAIDPSPVVVICPASLQLNWEREVKKWLVGETSATVGIFGGKGGEDNEDIWSDIVISSYGRAEKLLDALKANGLKPSLLIVDEAHYIKNPASKRSGIVGFRKEDEGGNLVSLSQRILLLTGTPAPNRPGDIWALFELLSEKLCGPTRKAWQARINKPSSDLGRKRAGVRARLLGMVRRKKSEVLTDLPAKTRKIVELMTTGKERKAIKAEGMAFDDAMGSFSFMVAARMPINGHTMTARRRLSELKVKRAVTYLEETLGPDEKVILFTYFKATMVALKDLLKDRGVVTLEGGMSAETRQETVDTFQGDPKVQIFIGQIVAACEGITLTASCRVVFVDLDWTPSRLEQAEDRAHRIGQKHGVLIEYLVYPGSIDYRIAKSLSVKTVARKELTE